MAVNFPGPYGVEIEYIVDGVTHTQELNCSVEGAVTVGQDPATIELTTRGGLPVNLQPAVIAWVGLTSFFFNNSVDFTAYTLWEYTPLSTERRFITTGSIGLSGQASGSTTYAHQLTWTFRTQEGNGMRIVLLEDVNDDFVKRSTGSGNAGGYQPLADFVNSDDNWILGRDTSFPIASLNMVAGQNEAIFRKRYR